MGLKFSHIRYTFRGSTDERRISFSYRRDAKKRRDKRRKRTCTYRWCWSGGTQPVTRHSMHEYGQFIFVALAHRCFFFLLREKQNSTPWVVGVAGTFPNRRRATYSLTRWIWKAESDGELLWPRVGELDFFEAQNVLVDVSANWR